MSRGLAAADAALRERQRRSSQQVPNNNDNSTHSNPVRIKIIAMGNAKTGKTCLIKRYCERRFVSKYVTTIGVDYGVKPVPVMKKKDDRGEEEEEEEIDVRVNFWDFSGHPDFLEVRNEFYKDVSAAFLVYDVTDRGTFDQLDDWLAEATNYGLSLMSASNYNPVETDSTSSKKTSSSVVALCGNKVDKGRRVVSESEGTAYAKSNGLKYFETSALSGACVDEMFEFLVQACV
mmetsp:Transcript_42385/g.51644  ORF Transcript_42385/g.51644 Transcript_42385/m.51644 type:complete len:233 (-) Transcript_42385:139-837(-)|eukprot:CAMPEP_0172482292 /NCGR_PEP_ID=MMETSP1066-20121228/8599_1 /TAXON_ID=671091 /ORGANISM="Coscinodiscus wailesii, Strain CCMP2513" /LENGTH=232 /DNA_ID=CAMNT_0013245285 /DNA_START=118 /DNA_END=816 /DNA_ORIENTATION=+